MKRTVLSIFAAFSLLVAPIVHAAEMDCLQDTHQVSEAGEKQSFEKQSIVKQKQSNKHALKDGHHCGCVHAFGVIDTEIKQETRDSTKSVFIVDDEFASSLILGPPLKPPSNA